MAIISQCYIFFMLNLFFFNFRVKYINRCCEVQPVYVLVDFLEFVGNVFFYIQFFCAGRVEEKECRIQKTPGKHWEKAPGAHGEHGESKGKTSAFITLFIRIYVTHIQTHMTL